MKNEGTRVAVMSKFLFLFPTLDKCFVSLIHYFFFPLKCSSFSFPHHNFFLSLYSFIYFLSHLKSFPSVTKSFIYSIFSPSFLKYCSHYSQLLSILLNKILSFNLIFAQQFTAIFLILKKWNLKIGHAYFIPFFLSFLYIFQFFFIAPVISTKTTHYG